MMEISVVFHNRFGSGLWCGHVLWVIVKILLMFILDCLCPLPLIQEIIENKIKTVNTLGLLKRLNVRTLGTFLSPFVSELPLRLFM